MFPYDTPFDYIARYYYSTPVGEQSIAISLPVCVCLCVCLSASISLELLDRSSQNFVCRSPVAMARSSSGGVAIRYVLPVLWMTSRLAVTGWSLMSMNALFTLVCVSVLYIVSDKSVVISQMVVSDVALATV